MERSQPSPVDEANEARNERRLVILAWSLFGLSILVLIAGYAFVVANGFADAVAASPMDAIIFPVGIVVISGLVGLLIVSKYPRHVIGWLLIALGLATALGQIGGIFAYGLSKSYLSPSNNLVEFLAWTDLWISSPTSVITLVLIPLYFPTGYLLSSRWRFAVLAGVLGMLTYTLGYVIHPDPLDWQGLPAANPVGLPGAGPLADSLIEYVSQFLILAAVLGAIGSVILRYRRSEGFERAQMKWVLYVLALGLTTILALSLLYATLPQSTAETLVGNAPYYAIFVFAMVLPIVIGVAILRYRLYDIDIIIRKTLTYGLLTGALLLVYFGSVVILQQLFTGISGQRSPVAIVISTLAIAALFRPLRQRFQEFIDRRFYRRNYDAAQTLADFAATARDEVDLHQLTAELVRVVQETMQPEQLGLWLKPMDGRSQEADDRQ